MPTKWLMTYERKFMTYNQDERTFSFVAKLTLLGVVVVYKSVTLPQQ